MEREKVIKIKKIFKSLLTLGIFGLVVFGVTQAYFFDVEKSVGNIFQAGKIDLKIDHTRATYNDIDCNTCSVILISDPTNMVVEKNGVPLITPTAAVYVGSNPPYFIHSAWTAEEDPTLAAAGAKWIWATDPTTQEDVENGAIYTFQKKFEWFGPIIGSDLWFAVGSDNSVEVWLNGIKVGENLGEFGYKKESMLHIQGSDITGNIVQGNNVLEFIVNNFPRPGQNPFSNPGGLIYKFEINGHCEGDYFKEHCKLWALKDLNANDYFWQLEDVKPGHHGLNVISYHVYDNDAYMCTYLSKEDLENTMIEPESPPDSLLPDVGELSKYIEVFIWNDDGDGDYESGEAQLANATLDNLTHFSVAEPPNPVIASETGYIGIAWCFGDLTATADSPFNCNGDGEQNDAQTDVLNETITFYVEQAVNNQKFSCSEHIPTPTPE